MDGTAPERKNMNTNFHWTEEHDIYLCREILVAQPFNFKIRSPERGRSWEKIAKTLNAIQRPSFRVTSRSVRDRYSLLATKRARKLRDEEKASGIDVICTELDDIVEEILEREKEAKEKIESETAAKNKRIEEDRMTAEDIREQAMERMAQTAKRKEEGTETVARNRRKKTRRSVSDVVELIQEKITKESASRKEEMDFRRKEQEAKAEREKIQSQQQERAAKQQETLLMNMVAQQQQQQQQQLQNLQAMFVAQQQQQTQALMVFMEKFANK